MAIEYLGLSAINGPMVVLEGGSGAAYDEIVEMTVDGNKRKLGRIIEVYEDKAVIQVFEGTEGMGLKNVHTRLTGHPMELGVSTEMLGRTMNGIGEPIDGLGEILPERMLDVNGKPLNPVTREYPRNYIRTGISAIDGLMTLIRGQKLPIFSGNGLPHDQLAAQIVQQASLGDDSDEQFAIVFAAMGVKHDVAEFFRRTFEESGVSSHVAMFMNLVYQTWLVAGGAENLRETIQLFWSFQVPWGWTYTAGATIPWIAQFSFGFYGLMLTSLILGILFMLLFRPRSWCAFCLMGSITQAICQLENRKARKEKELIQNTADKEDVI